jgi:hypothetical protein
MRKKRKKEQVEGDTPPMFSKEFFQAQGAIGGKIAAEKLTATAPGEATKTVEARWAKTNGKKKQ